jgi:hypothetical protein
VPAEQDAGHRPAKPRILRLPWDRRDAAHPGEPLRAVSRSGAPGATRQPARPIEHPSRPPRRVHGRWLRMGDQPRAPCGWPLPASGPYWRCERVGRQLLRRAGIVSHVGCNARPVVMR